jgi:hypothetical protein
MRTIFTVIAAVASIGGSAMWLMAANTSSQAANPGESVDMFSGMDSGVLQVKFVPKNDREATITIRNNTNQPLSVKLPDAFVGAPILAQGGGAIPRPSGTRNTSNNSQNQTAGGGLGGGLGGGGGGGAFNLAPEAAGKLNVSIVCLEHGKKDPSARIPYEIRPLESFTTDGNVKQLLTMFGQGNMDQRAAQAAAWHFANGMSWDELAAKKIHHLGGRSDEEYFSATQLKAAVQIAAHAEQLAKDNPPTVKPDPYSTGDSSDSPSDRRMPVSAASNSARNK